LGTLAGMKNKHNKLSGFTLLELMIILAISALLVQLAVPSYKAHIIRAEGLKAQAEQMQREINEQISAPPDSPPLF
jgi:Tfp pilus assembly protein PilE